MKISFIVNGKSVELDVSPKKRLLDILHDDLDLISVKEGCGKGECGACAVIFNGERVNSCLIPAFQADGSKIITLEGLKELPGYAAIERAYVEHGAVQCGFCLSGFVVSTVAFLKEKKSPADEAEIKEKLAGNLCRCTGYTKIIEAVKDLSLQEDLGRQLEAEVSHYVKK